MKFSFFFFIKLFLNILNGPKNVKIIKNLFSKYSQFNACFDQFYIGVQCIFIQCSVIIPIYNFYKIKIKFLKNKPKKVFERKNV